MLGTGVGLLAGLALLFWVMGGAADSYELDNRILGMAFYGACAGAVVGPVVGGGRVALAWRRRRQLERG